MKKSLKIIGIVVAVLVVAIALPCIIYGIQDAEKPNNYTDMDLSKTENKIYVSDADQSTYSNAMKTQVEPYVNQYKTEGTFTAEDGFTLHYCNFINPGSSKNICISHGYTENIIKYTELIYYFLRSGYSVFMLDHRGHGSSGRYVDEPSKVHIENFQDYVDDYATYVEKVVRPLTAGQPLYLYAHSMGGGIGAALLEQYPNMFDRAVLSCPMLDPVVSILPRPLTWVFANAACFFGMRESYLPAGVSEFPQEPIFSDVSCGSEIRYDYYFYEHAKNDKKLQTYNGTYGWLQQTVLHTDSSHIMQEDALAAIKTPTLVFESDTDNRVHAGAINHFVNNVESAQLIMAHDLKHELYDAPNDAMIPYINTVLEYYGEAK